MNKKLIRQIVIFALLLLVNFSIYHFSQAGPLLENVKTGGLKIIGEQGFNTTTVPVDIRITIAAILNRLLGFLGIILVGLIMYAGFLWMKAGGDPKEIDKAKAYLRNGVIGLIIILSAMLLTEFIMGCVIGILSDQGGYLFGGMCNGY